MYIYVCIHTHTYITIIIASKEVNYLKDGEDMGRDGSRRQRPGSDLNTVFTYENLKQNNLNVY